MKKGYSVIEILVVVGIFAVLGILVTQSVSLSLRSSKKSDSLVFVKQEVDYAADNIARLLQMAASVSGCAGDGAQVSALGFRDIGGNLGDFACLDTPPFSIGGTDPRIASSSGSTPNYQRMTSTNLNITNCTFSCYLSNSQLYVEFDVSANAKNTASEENSQYSLSKKILVRSSQKK